MKKILIIFAHPNSKQSKINKALKQSVDHLNGVTVHDLYANYPDFFIDIPREQQLCEANDIIIFQHPLYWYSTPAILKEWVDTVLEHSWAYGSRGNALQGKLFFQAITAGGDFASYTPEGINMFTLREFTIQYRAMAKICKMTWLPPFTVLGVYRGIPGRQLNSYCEGYKTLITSLREDRLDIDQAKQSMFLNDALKLLA